ncbi:Cysteine/Histidine-rich C1 domain family protein [Abeliophyllum distichum]|uniref:Cysteine/Histidine-rich C1 domain family protein n=1 Tax=Abeliophyllum distichum TaxID=126358 RepID=A0ABD1T087_9LAMI
MQSLLKSSASMGNNKNSQIEFPTSPQPTIGEEITHYTHSKHPLIEVNLSELFTCTGCKEYGSGKRFACQQCDFQLHEFCASSPPLLQNHPLHGQHQLVFHAKPKQAKAGIAWPKCDVCNKSTKGFIFRCRACSFQMHPCCAKLSTEINFPDVHPHTLKTVTTIKNILIICAKAFINGLRDNDIPTPEKPSMIGKTSRLVSQVVIEFIGGLIEGFGEGVGDYLVQNIVRGRCISSGRRSRTRE